MKEGEVVNRNDVTFYFESDVTTQIFRVLIFLNKLRELSSLLLINVKNNLFLVKLVKYFIIP